MRLDVWGVGERVRIAQLPQHAGQVVVYASRSGPLVRDIRYALRSLVRHKAFAIAALVTLALGIGATTAIFTVVSAVVLRPLPFAAPEQLVQIYGTPAERGEAIPLADLEAFRTQSTSFDAVAGYAVSARYLASDAGAARVMTVMVERDLLAMLGVPPLVGRTFRADDPANVAVVSHDFWRERLVANPYVIGTALVLDGESFTVIGVMPASFQFPYRSASTLRVAAPETSTDLWLPMYSLGQALRGRAPAVVARLKGGVPLAAAQSELAVITTRQDAANPPEMRGRGVRIEPLANAVVASSIRRPLFFLVAAVAIVLVLACVNVANLALVRITFRSREIAVRSALGASSVQLGRQFLTESLVLSLAGGVLGLVVARVGIDQLLTVAAPYLPRAREVQFDWRVFLFLLVVCTLTGLTLGLAPALAARRIPALLLLNESGGHATMGGWQRRVRDTLVIAEVALALVLAVGGTLLVRELVRLRHVDTGLVSDNVLTCHLGHRMTPQTDPRQFYAIADRVAALPGVRAAGLTQMLPLQNWGWFSLSNDFRRTGYPAPSPQFQIELRYVTPGYFDAIGIAVERGRAFTARDSRDTPPVIIINETLAKRYFADSDPIGQTTNRGTIVGVVRDVRQVHLDRPANPEIYYPVAQNWSQVSELGMTLVVKTSDPSGPVIDAVRSIVREVNPNLAVFDIKTLDRVVAESLTGFTLYLWLMAAFAGLAVVLACTGTYGVIAYVTSARTREFAIRLAVGADRASVTRLVLAQGARWTAIGLTLGVGAAFAAAPLLQNLPVNVRPPDIATVAPVAAFIAVAALAACVMPARRVAGIDPAGTLRNE